MAAHCTCRRDLCVDCRNRKIRKEVVRIALEHGGTVSFDMRTLLEDGWSKDTIRKVWRNPRTLERTGRQVSDERGGKTP